MDRMRMAKVDELRVSLGDSTIHSCCHRRVSSLPVNLRSDSLSTDILSTGTKGFHVLTKERINDDGLAGVYTSNSTVSRKGLLDGEGVADMGCINDFANMAGSRSKSNLRSKGHKINWRSGLVTWSECIPCGPGAQLPALLNFIRAILGSRGTRYGERWLFGDGLPTGKLLVWARHIVRVNSVCPATASWLSTGFRKVVGNGKDTLFWFDA
ncbi:hypothetical protein Ancab_002579 [Ancistrocladus abbreviatus]